MAGFGSALTGDEPCGAGGSEDAGDIEVEPQAEDVLGRVDPQGLLEDAERRIAGHVEREEARRADPPVVAEPDEEGGERQVPDQLVEERRVEGGERLVARWPMGGRYLQRPGQAARAPEELLVEVVADPPDRLSDEERRCGRVHEKPGGDSGAA